MGYDVNRFYNAKTGETGMRTYGECGGHDSLGFSNTLCPQACLTPSVRHGRAHFNGRSQQDHIVFDQSASAVRTPVRPRTMREHVVCVTLSLTRPLLVTCDSFKMLHLLYCMIDKAKGRARMDHELNAPLAEDPCHRCASAQNTVHNHRRKTQQQTGL